MAAATLHFLSYGSVAAVMIFLAAWLAAQVLHDRRLQAFCNPRLLGLAGHWPRRVCSAILVSVAAGALVALVGSAVGESCPQEYSTGLVALLIDPPPPLPGRFYYDSAWEGYVRDLQTLVENIRPERLEVYLSGSPPRLIVPQTRDVPGLFLLLDAGSPEYRIQTASDLTNSVEAIQQISFRPEAEAVSAVVVVSPRTEQEIDVAGASLRGVPHVVLVRSTRGGGAMEYRVRGANSQWMRLDRSGALQSLATDLSGASQERHLPDPQVLALVAFLSLFLECALRLLRSFGGGATLCKPAGKMVATGFSSWLLATFVCFASGNAAAVPLRPTVEVHRTLLQAVSPHIAVVTEISNGQPYVGEQLSVIYRMRCSVPPAAVDVDPQEFTGFWAVTAPITGQVRTDTATLNGRPATDFLLRQVILFPLGPGPQALPPLRLKIKRGGGSGEDWDWTASTKPAQIDVRPVPGAGSAQDTFVMVGDLEGKVSRQGSNRADEAVLEVEGTTNLDFFRLQEWLRSQGEISLLVRLRGTESLVQTRDYGGRRRVSLLQRQRWLVSQLGDASAPVSVEPFSVPFFDPQASLWRSLDFPAFVLGTGAGMPTAAPTRHLDAILHEPSRGRFRAPGTAISIAFIGSFLALLIVLISGLRSRGPAAGRLSASSGAREPESSRDVLGAGSSRVLQCPTVPFGFRNGRRSKARGGGH